MRALILGIGDAFTRLSFSTSALIEAPGGYVLIDCPDLVHRVIHEASARAGWKVAVPDIHDILLTHLHGDHCNGLESFGFARRGARGPVPRIHTSAPSAVRLWERLAPAMDGAASGAPRALDEYFAVSVLEPGRPAQVAGLEIECRFTKHPIPTIGLRIRDGDATLGWSSDTPFEQAHVDWLADADVIVHESNRGAPHTPIEKLNALPDEVRRKMRLIHLPDDFDPTCTDIPLLHQGEVIEF